MLPWLVMIVFTGLAAYYFIRAFRRPEPWSSIALAWAFGGWPTLALTRVAEIDAYTVDVFLFAGLCAGIYTLWIIGSR